MITNFDSNYPRTDTRAHEICGIQSNQHELLKTKRERERSKLKQAFTLIELLVVIAIIGILSVVVLVSLNDARDSGRSASVLSNLKNIHTQAEMYHIANDTYEGLCDDEQIAEMVSSLDASSDGAVCWVSTDTYSDYRTELAPIDFGIAANVNGTYHAAEPSGVITFDTTNTGGTQNWATATAACADGKRLSGPSAMSAIYRIDSATPTGPTGFTAGAYWSSLESPSDPSNAYRASLASGVVGRGDRSDGRYVRCVR